MPKILVYAFSGTVKELRQLLEDSGLTPDEEDSKAQEEIDNAILEQKTNSLDCQSVFNS